jgi:phosphocarrier protein HPr
MGVLMLAAERGSQLRISARGSDAEDAVVALSDLVGRGFDEA